MVDSPVVGSDAYAGIHILPAEILQTIFSACTDDPLPTKPVPEESPWLLTRVCRSWRHLAIAYPALWSSISVTVAPVSVFGARPQVLCSPPIEQLKCWLERSGLYPLSIELQLNLDLFDNDGSAIALRTIDQVLWVLRSHIPHTKTLSLHNVGGPITSANILPCAFILRNATILEDLELSEMPGFISSLSSTDLPRLRRFIWYGNGDSGRFLGFPIPWAQLRELTLTDDGGIHCADCLSVLKETPKLESFTASSLFNCGSHCSYSGGKVPLTRLVSLDVMGIIADVASFLQFLEIPYLEKMKLATYGYPVGVESLTIQLEHLFRSRRCPLKSLTIGDFSIPGDRLLSILRLVSDTLVSLRIGLTPNAGDEVLSALVVNGAGGNVLCPQLESLTLDTCLASALRILAIMVESRCCNLNTTRPLSELRIWLLETVDAHDANLARLKQAKSLGWLREFYLAIPHNPEDRCEEFEERVEDDYDENYPPELDFGDADWEEYFQHHNPCDPYEESEYDLVDHGEEYFPPELDFGDKDWEEYFQHHNRSDLYEEFEHELVNYGDDHFPPELDFGDKDWEEYFQHHNHSDLYEEVEGDLVNFGEVEYPPELDFNDEDWEEYFRHHFPDL